jgi:hypothetical protein
MQSAINNPLLMLVVAFALQALAALTGAWMRRRASELDAGDREDLGVVQTATLTLLGLIIGFSFSMAISRYDQRKAYEETEANTIGTEYSRADLLPPADAEAVRTLLREYLDLRIAFYETRDRSQLPPLSARMAQLQARLWAAVRAPAQAAPDAVTALVVSGMNEVIDSEGYTQAEWWNRIPAAGWLLMLVMALFANLLVGLAAKGRRHTTVIMLILPLIVSLAFLLIADIDSPRGGLIRVTPNNLLSLAATLRPT